MFDTLLRKSNIMTPLVNIYFMLELGDQGTQLDIGCHNIYLIRQKSWK